MSTIGTYLYAIVRTGTEIPPDLPGLDDDTPVRGVDHGPLTAITSGVPRDDFESERPEDPAWVVPRALRQALLIERLAIHGPVLPVRFGALFSSPEALGAWIALNRDAIVPFLDHVAGKEEWVLKLEVELDGALEALVAREPDWALRSRQLPASPGKRYFQEKRLRDQARHQARQTARVAAERVRRAARAVAEERVLVPRKPEQLGLEPVAHLAYLVPRDLVGAMLEQVSQAANDEACLRLVPSGPWPPAHFCPALVGPPGSPNERLT
jgi:hypothetical protein